MDEPIASIIIPVYNVQDYLRECLDSAIRQTLQNVEIICVNDGSTDGSLQILEEYRQRDPRIMVIDQENQGQSAARNSGLRRARGKYICFLDSDDYLAANMLSRTVSLADEQNLDGVIFNYTRFTIMDGRFAEAPDQIKPIYGISQVQSGPECYGDMIDHRTWLSVIWRCLCRNTFLRENNLFFMDGILHEDVLYFFQVLMAAERMIQIPDKLYYYRAHPDSIMSTAFTHRNVEGAYYSAKGVLPYLFQDVRDPIKDREIRRAFAAHCRLTRRYYKKLTPAEQAKVSFPKALDDEIFKLILDNDTSTDQREETIRLQHELDCIRASVSFRIGRAITWLPRKLRGGIRCLQEHDLRYTVHRTIEHLTGKAK